MTDHLPVLAFLRGHQDDMTRDLVRLVEFESPSDDKPSLDRLAGHLLAEAQALGADAALLPHPEAGAILRAHWGAHHTGGVLLLCHMDTVWDLGTLAQRPVRIEDGRLYAAGAFDMKGGIVNALWAIRALQVHGLMPERRITLLITADEETGSATSRAVIEAEALAHDAVLVLEPAHPPHGALKTWRKGVGEYRLEVQGVASHAGAAHEEGVNALEELAHQVLAIQALTDYGRGTTVNVGVAGGGTRDNVVPDRAWALIDVRVMNAEEADRLHSSLTSLQPHVKGASVTVTGGMNRPPMERTPGGVALFRRAEAVAAGLGFAVAEVGTGGGSDGNFTAALGVPTLDGLGVTGDGSHAVHEHVILSSLPERAALLAGMLCE